jgi:hypothetical protein
VVATLALAGGVWLLSFTPPELRAFRPCSSVVISAGAVLLALWLIKVLVFPLR